MADFHELHGGLQDGLRRYQNEVASDFEAFTEWPDDRQDVHRSRLYASLGIPYQHYVTPSGVDSLGDLHQWLDRLLLEFESIVRIKLRLGLPVPSPRKWARLGFCQAGDERGWQKWCEQFVDDRCVTSFSVAYMEAYGDRGSLVAALSFFVLGALLELEMRGVLTSDEFTWVDQVMVGLIDENSPRVCTIGAPSHPPKAYWFKPTGLADGRRTIDVIQPREIIEIFEGALARFRKLLIEWESEQLSIPDKDEIARIGFASVSGEMPWRSKESDFVAEVVGTISEEDLAEYGEIAPRVRAFDIYALGVCMAYLARGWFDTAYYEMATMHLPRFIDYEVDLLRELTEANVSLIDYHRAIGAIQDGLRRFEASDAGSIEEFLSRSPHGQEVSRQRYFASLGFSYDHTVEGTNVRYELNADALFQPILAKFEDLIETWLANGVPFWTQRHFAICGFETVDSDNWGSDIADYIIHRLRNAFSTEYMAVHGDRAALVIAFNCFALGTLLGLYKQWRLAGPWFLQADIDLVAFSDREAARICALNVDSAALPTNWVWKTVT